MECLVCGGRLGSLAVLSEADDIRDDIVGAGTNALLFHAQSHLDVWLCLGVRIGGRVFSESLRLY